MILIPGSSWVGAVMTGVISHTTGIVEHGGLGCFRCGQIGHIGKDCPHLALIYFRNNQTGHKKADYPRFSGGAVVAPAPATLSITDG